jgi:hypothetical protein
MTIRFMDRCLPSIELLQQPGPQLPGCFGIERRQYATRRRRNMSGRTLVGFEHVVTESVMPCRALFGRQIADAHDREHQRVHRRIHVGGRLAPPVIDEDVQGVQGLDVMPPHARNEYRIAGPKLGDLHVTPRCHESREFLQVGLCEVHEADGLARRREIQRPDVEIVELVRRKQGEAPVPDGDASEVVGQIVVRGDPRSVADPHADEGLPIAEVQVVFPTETRQAGVYGCGADIE